MEEKLIKKFRVYLLTLELVMLIASIFAMYYGLTWSIAARTEQLLNQEAEFYQTSVQYHEEMMEHYREDLAARLSSVAYVLHSERSLTTNGMGRLAEMLNLEDIYVFGQNNTIVLSSSSGAIGRELLDNEDAAPFRSLMEEENGAFLMYLDAPEILPHGPDQDYAALKVTLPGYSMIMVGIDKSAAHRLQETSSVSGIVSRIPTTENESLFALDAGTHKVLGAAMDNDPSLNIAALKNMNAQLERFMASGRGYLLWDDNHPVFYRVKEVGSIVFLALVRPVEELHLAQVLFIAIVAALSLLVFMIVTTTRRFFRKYVFNEFQALQKGIQEMMAGREEVSFQMSSDPEFELITGTLTQWNKVVHQTRDKIQWFTANSGQDTAVFEFYAFMNVGYWSENLQELLGLEEARWNALKDDAPAFQAYCEELYASRDEEGIVEQNGRFLGIQLYKTQENVMGFVVDRTQELQLRRSQSQALEKAITDSETDSLTGLCNRRGFELRFRAMMARRPRSMGMWMIDVDNFKVVNDTLGHPVGDRVLQEIARVLRSLTCPECVSRLGGDEFAVLLPDMSEDTLKEKLDVAMEALRQLQMNMQIPFTVSIGAVLLDREDASFQELYRFADSALYGAKQAGKNRYAIHDHHLKQFSENRTPCGGARQL